MKTFSIIVLLLISVVVIDGWHFLGGTITWRPLNESATGSPVAIVITQTYSWTYSLMPCTSSMVATNQFVPSYGGSLLALRLNCIANCGSGSVGYSPLDIIPYCTDFSAPVGTTVGQRSDIVYLQAGDDFSAAFQSGAWRPLTPDPAASWSLGTRINVNPRPDNGLYNNAPVATMMSPIYIPVNQPKVIHIPIADADRDTLRCRWSTNTNGVDECGGVCPPSSLPPGTVIYPNCTIIITGQTVGDWFGVALMVEDFINSTSTTPLSSVPVQFLVHVVAPPPCTTPPEIIGIPTELSCTPVTVGQPFISQLFGINNCGPTITIADIATLSFPGMIQTNIDAVNSSLYYKNLTWTPTTAQLGYQVMCAMAFDSQNAQSSQYCFTFYVSITPLCACPSDQCITTITTTTSPVTTKEPNVPIWPFIGTLIGLLALGVLAVCCCLCCRFCCFPAIEEHPYGTIELYHIEPCTDSSCPWRNNKYNDIYGDFRFETTSIRSFDLSRPFSNVSVAIIKRCKTKHQERNHGIKPRTLLVDEKEMIQYQNRKMNNDVNIHRLDLRRYPMEDNRPSAISTIYLNDENGMDLRSNLSSNIRTNTTLSRQRSIPLDEIQLSRLVKRSKSNPSQISNLIEGKQRRKTKMKLKSIILLRTLAKSHP